MAGLELIVQAGLELRALSVFVPQVLGLKACTALSVLVRF